MKKIFIYTVLASALAFGTSSCESYFDVELEQNIPTRDAYKSVQDVQNGMIGAYYTLGSYRFYGKNVIAIGDMASDLAVASTSSGHFVAINTYVIDDTNLELDQTWEFGYKLIDRCVRTIGGAEYVESQADVLHLSDDDKSKLKSYKSQCYALRALSVFTLTNLFGLPYQPGQTNGQLGVCLLDKKPLEAFVNIKRSTVEECYAQVLSDIAAAKEYYTGVFPSGTPQFFFNEAAIYALEARVNLFMGKYPQAKAAAEKAIALRKSGDVSNEMYVKMWSSTAVTDEDILTISKSDDDNLSSNSLNTLYGSYKGAMTTTTQNALGTNDARRKLLKVTACKFQGIPTSQATSNIPVFRKSEMYLIIAECEAKAGNEAGAKTALGYTTKRNPDFNNATLSDNSAELLTFIAQERIRELFQEGHRFYDARRTGAIISGQGYKDFEIAKFAYPIPANEINAGFCNEQNPGWSDNLPKK